jgi:diguanylate cyclase (GGDEF)-like protein
MLVDRSEFLREVDRRLVAGQHAGGGAMLFLNLDRFEVIRDNLGVEAGQHTLDVIGRRLQTCLRGADLLGRLRGDEFAILLAAPSRQEEAAIVAERIAEQLRAPLSIGDQQLALTASIGVALAEPGQDAAGLIRNADIAMCQAKDGGRARYRVFDPAMRAQAWERMHLETALHRAIEHDEFRVFYQPMVDLATGQVIGCEALVRWLDPEHSLISPSVFIPVAEETGMIVPIGRRVLEPPAPRPRPGSTPGASLARDSSASTCQPASSSIPMTCSLPSKPR